MKNTLRTMSLVAAGLLGTASVALAQPAPAPAPPPPAPDAPPAPPPAAPPAPPPVDFGVAPAALPSAPVGTGAPVPTVSWGATPGADTTSAPPEEEKKQSPFYFTRFNWGNAVAADGLGVGQNPQTTIPTYNMSFSLNLRYYFLNEDRDKAYVNANAGVAVEVTDTAESSSTTKREPLLNDTIVGVGYSHTLYQSADKQWKTAVGPSVSVALPTSKFSYDQGKYLGTGISANIIQAVPLAGAKSDWFPDLLAFGVVGYNHTFSHCTDACNSAISYGQYPRTAPDGSPYNSDLLSFRSLRPDKVKLNLTYFLTIYKDLSLANTWEIQGLWPYAAPATSITNVSTGPVNLGTGSTGNFNPVTTFDVSLSYTLFNTARIDVGYENITQELNDNKGARNSVFYTPGGSEFYGNVSIYIDRLIDKAMSPPDKKKLAQGRFHREAF